MYTQYIANPVTINPAIAGTRMTTNLTAVFRKQWLGMEGAPTTATISYQTALNKNKVGIGANLVHDRIGPVIQTGLYLDYAYHLTVDQEKNRKLSLGLMGGFNYYTFDLLSLRSDVPDDDILHEEVNSRFLPNFGFGLYYYTPKFILGVSLPKLLRNSLSNKENTLTAEDKEERHLFLMTGYKLELSEKIDFKPSIIGRFVNGAPASLDLNGTFVYNDRIWLGALYRVGVSWGIMAGWQISKQLFLAYSYDFNHKLIRGSSFGSHEISISYDLKWNQEKISSPRYF